MATRLSPLLLAAVVLLARLPTASLPAAESVSLETPSLRFTLSPETGRYEILDKTAAVVWSSNPYRPRFGEVTLRVDGKTERRDLTRCDVQHRSGSLTAVWHPRPDRPGAALRLEIQVVVRRRGLEFAYEADAALNLESVRLLDDALWVTDREQGYAVVPVREGLLLPADSGLNFSQRFDTFAYEGCHMEMLGVVKRGAAALVTWHDPYVAADIRSAVTNLGGLDARQVLSPSLTLRRSARSFQVQFLGRGDYGDIARAYRGVAQEKGWWVPWSEKLQGHPDRAKYFGASNYKLWSVLDRRMNEDSSKELSVKVNWTFDQAAQVAEHLRHDLRLDRVLFILGGWIHRGYDNQHPDILPTAPECGGDLAFSNACRRIRALGYVLSLHDNYQDIYRDAPSWNEAYVAKNPDGSLTKGGHWAGGIAYITCAQKALELARRPQNLAAVKRLSDADSYFIDTTYAAGLYECFDPNHPLTRAGDLKWKQAISDYARGVFGSFGSECGREWAIPHADFFEGLTGVSGTHYHNKDLVKNLGATVVPLFEMVYRDCIAMYGKYGYDPAQAADYVLHHLSLGRPLHYHNVPRGLYWKTRPGTNAAAGPPAASDDPGVFTHADRGWAEGLHPFDRFVKNTHEMLSPLNELTAQVPMTRHEFLSPDRRVRRSVFGAGKTAVEVVVNGSRAPYRARAKLGGEVNLPPNGFLVESPTFVAFHAANWNGLAYEVPPLFTLRSLDGKPLARSRQVRVFHAFGDPRLRWGDTVEEVRGERVLAGR